MGKERTNVVAIPDKEMDKPCWSGPGSRVPELNLGEFFGINYTICFVLR
jgi:hypothetical protein